jgi:hypothetical protein
MSIELSEEHSVFICTECGELYIIGFNEQPLDECEKCNSNKRIENSWMCRECCIINPLNVYNCNYCGSKKPETKDEQ